MTKYSPESISQGLICTTCKVTKSAESFGVSRRTKNNRTLRGRAFMCLACSAAWHKAYYAKNKERLRAANRARRLTWSETYKKAHQAVTVAIRDGVLIRPSACSSCSKDRPLDAHHDDYSRPLDVRWLCDSCHRIAHKDMAKESIAS